MAVEMKAEAIMDLSCYGKTHNFRQQLIDTCPAMIGTVPMYDAVGYLDKELADITADEFLEVIEAHAKEGVDFMTIHAGINRRTAAVFKETERVTNIVSRGGSLIYAWMEMTGNGMKKQRSVGELRDFDLEKELISGAAYLHFQYNRVNREAMEESR